MFRNFLFLILISTSVLATQRMATVTGNVFLSDSTNHSGVKVLFQSLSASATTDSVYSTSTGSFAIGLTDGIYSVIYSKNGFIPVTLSGSYSWGNGDHELPDITLQAGSVVEVSGNVSGTWYDNTLIEVVGDLTIPEGDTLIIQPGVNVYFMGNHTLNIYGSILAVGTETDSITFTSGQAIKSATDWEGIDISTSGPDSSRTIIFQYCNFSYGGSSNLIESEWTSGFWNVPIKVLNSI